MKVQLSEKVANDVASILYDVGAVLFRPKQPFRYDSGILSPVYTDNRLIISYPKERLKITNYMIKKVQIIGIPDVIAGTATAGIPHAAFIAQRMNLPMVYVRSQTKNHGKGNQVEGKIKRGQKVLIIEDLVSTAGSSIRVAQALRKLGAKVTDELAIFTYSLKEAEINLKKSRIKLHYLTDLKHSANTAVKKGFLKQEQVKIILDWANNPKAWAGKMGFE